MTTTTARPFRSQAAFYSKNIRDGRNIKARAAILEHPEGIEERGLAIIIGGMPSAVIPAADALRLAHELAAQLDYLNGQDTP